jgi:hypothetical protein
MSETLEERLRREARDNCVVRAHVYARDVVELLDARDKTIAEQRAVIAELSNEPITEFETLRQAHDAQNEVIRKKQAEIRRLQAELDSTRAWFANFIQREFEKELVAVRAERDALRAENAALREKTNVGH